MPCLPVSDSNDDEDSSSVSSLELKSLNISNDQYYQSVNSGQRLKERNFEDELDIPKYGSTTIQHSLPAYDLWRPFFPTHLSDDKFRIFHRPKLRHYNTGPQSRSRYKKPKAFPIKSLSKAIYRYQKKLRYKVIRDINNGRTREEIVKKHLLIRNAKDLTAKQGELFLFEYSEEYPPVLSQIGMAANVKTIKRTSQANKGKVANNKQQQANRGSKNSSSTRDGSDKENGCESASDSCNDRPNVNTTGIDKIGFDEFVSTETTTKQVYYNQLKPDTELQVIENNMTRAPIFKHRMPSCDFLVIRTRNSLYVRQVPTIFTVGQLMPLVAIPQPTHAAITKFRSDLSNNYIHKLFEGSDTDPPSVDLNYILKIFPDYSRQTIRNRITNKGAKSQGDGIFSVGFSRYGQMSPRELRRAFTPEQYCLNMAMLAARERLRELNYTESMINPTNDAELETEVLAAPWNTSKAVLKAFTGKNFLDLRKHLIDPTGPQREGFSCVSWSKSPTEDQQIKEQQAEGRPRCVAPLAPNPLMYKIKREKLERLAIYQREAQMIAEVQSKVLSSGEVLSSDDEIDDEDDGEDDENLLDTSFDEQLHDLDRLIVGGRTTNELNFEKEEEERREMMKTFNQNGRVDVAISTQQSATHSDSTVNVGQFKNKILHITRTYDSPDGKIQRTEIVREPKIIALYVKQKGGILNESQSIENETHNNNNVSNDRFKQNHHRTPSMTRSNGPVKSGENGRRQSFTLGPSELCRADGTVLTISKKVLNVREMRRHRLNSRRESCQ